MRKIKAYIVVLFILLFNSIYASKISGYVDGCKGRELQLYVINNFMTNSILVLDSCVVDENNYYEFYIDGDTPIVCNVDLGLYIAQIIVAPDKDVIVDLPEYVALTRKQFLNPYFSKETILLYDQSVKDLNFYVYDIESYVDNELKSVLSSLSPSSTAALSLDSINQKIESFDNPFLKNYLRYSSAIFHRFVEPEKVNLIKELYFQNSSVDLINPAFTQLISSEYPNPFIADDGLFYKEVSDAMINSQLSPNFVDDIAKIHNLKSRDMAELIAIMGFYSAAAYASTYRSDIVKLMAQLEELILDEELKHLCVNTRLDMEKLMVGYPAPYYELYTVNDKKVPTVLKRKNVLLAFVNTNIYDCQRHLQMLENIKTMYKRDIEVVVVGVYQERQELERFLSRNEFENLFFVSWDNNEKLLFDYDIKSLPTYYLVDENGNFVYAPMSSPDEDMLMELQAILGY